jgi:hypothetical protein
MTISGNPHNSASFAHQPVVCSINQARRQDLRQLQDLHDDDMLSIIHLVSCIEEADLPFFMAVILYISH